MGHRTSQMEGGPSIASPLSSIVLSRKCDCGQHTFAGGECSSCSNEHALPLQRSAITHPGDHAPGSVPPIVHEVLNSPGQPLDESTRAFMEPRFRHDFSRVRVHTDSQAAESARAVNALAYTVGPDIVLGADQYKPGTLAGRRLLAHELTHVLQQSVTPRRAESISHPDDPHERQADEVANAVSLGAHVGIFTPPAQTMATLHRVPPAASPNPMKTVSVD